MKKDLHSLFQKLTHGVYVIGVSCNGENNAFTASWVMQVSFTPLLLALSINPDHSSYKLLKEGGVFSVNVLPKDRFDLAEHFGQPESTDKLSSVVWHQGKTTARSRGSSACYRSRNFRCYAQTTGVTHELPRNWRYGRKQQPVSRRFCLTSRS